MVDVLGNRDIKTIGKHINNALEEELADLSVVANFATTAADGMLPVVSLGDIRRCRISVSGTQRYLE